ncbi:MAG: hypothetical protein AMJ43_07085 [Coxiella sp. DG_40]|nr:MAG: hypothetical protein AMJ43_07085 [Coxiella sp. DG_40]
MDMFLRSKYNHIAERIRTLIKPYFAILCKMEAMQNLRRKVSSLEGFITLNWKRLFNIEQKQVLGLDIGSSAVKMVQLRKDNGGFTVTAAGIAEITNSTEDDENLKEQVNTIAAIGKCLWSTGTQTKLAVCSVCGPEVAVRYFKFPSLPSDEIQGAVLFEAAQVCPFNIEDSAVDYQLIPNGKDCTTGVLVAATNKLIKRKTQLAKNASLDTVLMDVDGLALLNCLSEYKNSQKGISETDVVRTTAILNVGSSFTTLAIIGDNNLPFIRDMTYAGNDIIKEIAAENNLSTETVNKILTGGEVSDHSQLKLSDGLAKACQKLITNVIETLRYYTTQEKSSTIEKILVCGGFALVKGFVELLDSQLPVPTVLWNPFDKIRYNASQPYQNILQKNGPALAVAAGLAMRSI